jgi:hypothetical protein
MLRGRHRCNGDGGEPPLSVFAWPQIDEETTRLRVGSEKRESGTKEWAVRDFMVPESEPTWHLTLLPRACRGRLSLRSTKPTSRETTNSGVPSWPSPRMLWRARATTWREPRPPINLFAPHDMFPRREAYQSQLYIIRSSLPSFKRFWCLKFFNNLKTTFTFYVRFC